MKNIVEDMGPSNFFQAYRMAVFQYKGKILEMSGIAVKQGTDVTYLTNNDQILQFERGVINTEEFTLENGTQVPFMRDEQSRTNALLAAQELLDANLSDIPCDDSDDEDYDEDSYNEWSCDNEHYNLYINFLSSPDLCIRQAETDSNEKPVLHGVYAKDIETGVHEVVPVDFFDSLAVFGQYSSKLINVVAGAARINDESFNYYLPMAVRPDTRCLRMSQYSVPHIVEYFKGASYFTLEQAIQHLRKVAKVPSMIPSTGREVALNENYTASLRNNAQMVISCTKTSKTIATIDLYSVKVTAYVPNLKKFLQLEGIK